MLDLPYYRLELDDYAAAAFTSFSKEYFGTLDDIRGLITALEQDEETFIVRYALKRLKAAMKHDLFYQ